MKLFCLLGPLVVSAIFGAAAESAEVVKDEEKKKCEELSIQMAAQSNEIEKMVERMDLMTQEINEFKKYGIDRPIFSNFERQHCFSCWHLCRLPNNTRDNSCHIR